MSKSIAVFIVSLAVGIILFILAHDFATSVRGYQSVGGEFFALLMPLWVWMAMSVWSSRER